VNSVGPVLVVKLEYPIEPTSEIPLATGKLSLFDRTVGDVRRKEMHVYRHALKARPTGASFGGLAIPVHF